MSSFTSLVLLLAVAAIAVVHCAPLRLIHFNDPHGRWDAESTSFTTCKSLDTCFGGFPKLTSAAAAYKASAPGDALILHAGDQFVGTLYDAYYTEKGDVVVHKFLNLMGINFFAPGNHDYDYGPAIFSSFATKLNASVVACNTRVNATALPELAAKMQPFAVTTLPSGLKVGVVGFTTPDTAFTDNPGPDITFLPTEATAKQCAAQARAAGAQIVIALSHLGYSVDLSFAANFSEYDVIVGAHSHSFLYDSGDPLILNSPATNETAPVAGAYPTLVTSAGGKQIPIVQAYWGSRYLGVLDLDVNLSGPTASVTVATTGPPEPILLGGANSTNPIPDDPAAAALLDILSGPVKAQENAVVGVSSVFLNGSYPAIRIVETNLGDIINDSCAWFIENTTSLFTDIFPGVPYAAVYAAGSLRSSIDAGNITLGEITAAMPYGNTLLVKQMNASGLLADLNAAMSVWNPAGAGAGAFPQIGHMAFSFSPSTRPNNSRIVRAMVYDLKGKGYDLTQVPPDFNVLALINNYQAAGGDGYNNMATSPVVFDTSTQFTEILADYISAFTPVAPVVDGRIANCDDTPTAPLCSTAPPPSPPDGSPPPYNSPPPPTKPKPKTCTWNGVYRIESVGCPGKFISFVPATGPGKGCANDTVTLRSAGAAPTGARSWKLIAKAQQGQQVVASRVAAAQRLPTCPFKINLASADSTPSPRLAGTFWKLRIKPVSYTDCRVATIQAVAGAKKDSFLAYSSTCAGSRAFRWVGKTGERAARWKLTKV